MAGCLFIQGIRFLSFVSMSQICPLLQLLLFPNHPENHAFLLPCPLQTRANLVCMTIFNGYGSFTWLSRFWYYLVLIYLFHASFHCLSENPIYIPSQCLAGVHCGVLVPSKLPVPFLLTRSYRIWSLKYKRPHTITSSLICVSYSFL